MAGPRASAAQGPLADPEPTVPAEVGFIAVLLLAVAVTGLVLDVRWLVMTGTGGIGLMLLALVYARIMAERRRLPSVPPWLQATAAIVAALSAYVRWAPVSMRGGWEPAWPDSVSEASMMVGVLVFVWPVFLATAARQKMRRWRSRGP